MRSPIRSLVFAATAVSITAVALPQGQTQLLPGRCEKVDVTQPQSLLFADLDGDLDQDLVLGGENGLCVLLTDGAGGIVSTQTYAASQFAHDLGLGDLDEDGADDLVFVADGWAKRFQVLWGNGSGGFSSPSIFTTATGAGSVEVVDLDGDTHLDVVLANPGGVPPTGVTEYSVSLLFGDGAGQFAAPVTYELGTGTNKLWPKALVVDDLNADGSPDVIAGGGFGLAVLVNDGQGGVARLLRIAATYTVIEDLAVGDCNGDGAPDVVAGGRLGPDTAIDLYLGAGTGVLQLVTSHVTSGRIDSVDFADIDGDAALDVVAANSGECEVQVLFGDGLGGLGEENTWPASYPRVVRSGDLDGDGWTDLFVGISPYHLQILSDDGEGNLLGARTVPAPGAGWLEVGDLDADGSTDLVASCADEKWIHVVPLAPDGTFLTPILSPTTFTVQSHAVVEMTGDSRLDVLANDWATGDLVLLEGDGTGRVSERDRWQVGSWPNRFVTVDLDGNRRLDVAVANQALDTVSTWLGDGQGGLTLVGTWGVGDAPTSVTAGDLDRDGKPDLVVSNGGSDSVSVLIGDGHGGVNSVTSFPCDNWPNRVCVADLDTDGDLDVVTANSNVLGSVSVLLGDGQGALSPPTNLSVLAHPLTVHVGDVDGDGSPDLVVGSDSSNIDLAVLLGDGLGGFGSETRYGACGGGAKNLALADFDHDGRLDVALASPWHVEDLTVFINILGDVPSCTTQEAYCVAKLNSAGCLPRICSTGTPSASGPDDFMLTAEKVVGHQFGLFLWGRAPAALPLAGGTLCVSPPIWRTPVQNSGGPPKVHDCSGSYAYHLSQTYMAAHALTPGAQLFGQYWSRDHYLPPPFNSGLTDALRVTIEP